MTVLMSLFAAFALALAESVFAADESHLRHFLCRYN